MQMGMSASHAKGRYTMPRKKQLQIAIGPIEHVPTEKDRSHNELVCSICHCEFDIELEGGIDGYLGVLPVAMCAMCYSGLDEFFTQMHGCYDDEHDGYEDHDED